MTAKQRIYIADDHAMFIEGIIMALGACDEHYEVCGFASIAEKAFAEIREMKPDLVIVDLRLVYSSGLDLIRDLVMYFRNIRILVISMQDDNDTIRTVRRSGAHGFISKSMSMHVVLHAIALLLRGETYFLMEECKSDEFTLSCREAQVLREYSYGISIKVISEQLGVTQNTVRTYLTRIRKKHGLRTIEELRMFADSILS